MDVIYPKLPCLDLSGNTPHDELLSTDQPPEWRLPPCSSTSLNSEAISIRFKSTNGLLHSRLRKRSSSPCPEPASKRLAIGLKGRSRRGGSRSIAEYQRGDSTSSRTPQFAPRSYKPRVTQTYEAQSILSINETTGSSDGEHLSLRRFPSPANDSWEENDYIDVDQGASTVANKSIRAARPKVKEISTADIQDMINKLFKTPLPESKLKPPKEFGFIYMLRKPKSLNSHIPGTVVKIGSALSVTARKATHLSKCDPSLEDVKRWALPSRLCKRTERLIHLKLKNYRHQFPCRCGVRHIEYFQLPEEEAWEVIERWVTYMNTESPYDESRQLTSRATWQYKQNMGDVVPEILSPIQKLYFQVHELLKLLKHDNVRLAYQLACYMHIYSVFLQ